MEKWRKIRSYSKYEINRNGEVRNVDTHEAIEPTIDRKGNLVVSLVNMNGIKHAYRIDELLTETYVTDRPNEFYIVKHKDGNFENMDVENLEWVLKPLEDLPRDTLYRNVVIYCPETKKSYYNIYAASEELHVNCRNIADSLISGKPCEVKSGHYTELYHFEVVRIED